MSAEVIPFPAARVAGGTHHAHDAEVIPLGAVSHGLTQHDLNGIESVIARSHGRWRCEIEESETGISALILPNRSGRGEPHGFLVSRDGGRLTLLDARPNLEWPTLGMFADRESLLDALSHAMGSFAAA
jgi:hypothetical protein